MSSIFRKDDNHVEKPNRNVFDLSFQNNLTTQMGRIIPVMCQPVVPGDSFKIDASFGLRYLPQKFPVQTRQRASIKFYYVRNRNLWKDWEDFIGKTKEGLVPPYFKFSDNFNWYLRPSSYADYLGVPIKVEVPAGSGKTLKLCKPWYKGTDITYIPNGETFSNSPNEPLAIYTKKNIAKMMSYPTSATYKDKNFELSIIYGGVPSVSETDTFPSPDNVGLMNSTYGGVERLDDIYWYLFRHEFKPQFPLSIKTSGSGTRYLIVRTKDGKLLALALGTSLQLLNNIVYYTWNDEGEFTNTFGEIESIIGVLSYKECVFDEFAVNIQVSEQSDVCWCDIALSDLPFCSTENPDGIRLSAMPWRAVTSIYNALIRNQENNPLIVDGQPEYNKYIVNDKGGESAFWKDMNEYQANWSDDKFTTALPSPQQGNAPLVGLTGVNGATLTVGDEDKLYKLNLQVDSDTGNVIAVQAGENTPEDISSAILSATEFGITINDLRNVNAYQRWKENNIRRGYKYRDQIKSHYGVSVRYDVLDMPEFLGGISRDVTVNQIVQTVENEYGKLGEYGGNSYVMGSGQSINHFCDEHGFIIGLMEIKPMPLYQDQLKKFLTLSDPFDIYFPEFGKIGPQPIANKELSFSQSYFAESMDKTFGYQRAWYDYLENTDEVHGEFRFALRDFIMARDFGNMPTLSESFLTVDSDDINNTFYTDDDTDKIVGQIYFDIKAKRPIPLLGIPSIE